MGWSITGIMIRAPATLRKKPRKVSEIQTQAVTYDSNAHVSLPLQGWVEAYPLQVFLVINLTHESVILKRYIEAAKYLFVALIKALKAF